MLGESVCGDVGLMGGAQLGTRQGREERRAGKGKGARMARLGGTGGERGAEETRRGCNMTKSQRAASAPRRCGHWADARQVLRIHNS